MPYANQLTIRTSTSVGSTSREDASDVFSVAPNENVEIQVSGTVAAASPLLVFVEKNQDSGTPVWDNSGQSRLVMGAGSPAVASFTIGGNDSAFEARLTFALQTGTTAATGVTATIRKWTVS